MSPQDLQAIEAELLEECFETRTRRLVQLGRQSRTDPELSSQLAGWARGDWQHQQWVLFVGFGSRDGAPALHLLEHGPESLYRLAAEVVCLVATDAEVADVLPRLSPRRQYRTVRHLVRRRRQPLVDRFVAGLRATSPAEAWRFESQATDWDFDGDRVLRWGWRTWLRRAQRRPDETVAAMIGALRRGGDRCDPWLLEQSLEMLRFLATFRHDLTLRLVYALLPLVSLQTLLKTVSGFYAGISGRILLELMDPILNATDHVEVGFAHMVPLLGRELLWTVLEKRPASLPFWASWFSDLDDPLRRDLFRDFHLQWRDSEGRIESSLVCALPHDLRVSEARRHLDLPALATDIDGQAKYLPLLPWPEVVQRVQPWLSSSEIELRRTAWMVLSRAAWWNPPDLDEFLAMMQARRHEADPVRSMFLSGLQSNSWRLQAEHLPVVADIARSALDATDLSQQSLTCLVWSFERLLTVDPDWALDQLAGLYRERGLVDAALTLTDDQARRFTQRLLPLFQHWWENNHREWVFEVIHQLRQQVRVCPWLADRVFDMKDWLSLRYVLDEDEYHAHLEQRLRDDPKLMTDPVVFEHLWRRRQDLLGPGLCLPALAEGDPCSTFLSFWQQVSKSDALHRLTTPQQQALGATLSGMGRIPPGVEPSVDVCQVFTAQALLAELPAADHTDLLRMTRDPRPVFRDHALLMIGRLDSSVALPVLVEAFGGSGRRFAIQAVRRPARDLRPERLVAQLGQAPLDEVSSTKEVVRLMGELGGDAGWRWLQARARQTLHRDVRITLLRSLRWHLDRDEAWPLLEEAAYDPTGERQKGLLKIPTRGLDPAARLRLNTLLASILRRRPAGSMSASRDGNDPDFLLRWRVLQHFVNSPLTDPERRIFDACLSLIDSRFPQERQLARRAVWLMLTPDDAERMAETLRNLLPQRRAFEEWLTEIREHPWRNQSQLTPVLRRLRSVVDSQPVLWMTRIWLAAVDEGVEGLRVVLRQLRAQPGGLHAGALLCLADRIAALGLTVDASELESLEAELTASPEAEDRYLALRALQASRTRVRWTIDQLERLKRFREDVSPLVASHAQSFLLPWE
jgi:hypothetical protein